MAEEEFVMPPLWYEDVKARLKELGISQSTMARALGHSQKHISLVLNGMAAPSLKFLSNILYYVGLEMTTSPVENMEYRGADGHWFFGERCQHCGINYLDAGMYHPDEKCPGAVK